MWTWQDVEYMSPSRESQAEALSGTRTPHYIADHGMPAFTGDLSCITLFTSVLWGNRMAQLRPDCFAQYCSRVEMASWNVKCVCGAGAPLPVLDCFSTWRRSCCTSVCCCTACVLTDNLLCICDGRSLRIWGCNCSPSKLCTTGQHTLRRIAFCIMAFFQRDQAKLSIVLVNERAEGNGLCMSRMSPDLVQQELLSDSSHAFSSVLLCCALDR